MVHLQLNSACLIKMTSLNIFMLFSLVVVRGHSCVLLVPIEFVEFDRKLIDHELPCDLHARTLDFCKMYHALTKG